MDVGLGRLREDNWIRIVDTLSHSVYFEITSGWVVRIVEQTVRLHATCPKLSKVLCYLSPDAAPTC